MISGTNALIERDRIAVTGDTAQLIVGGELRATASAAELRQLVVVELAPDPHVSQELSLVLELNESVWVVPEFTSGRNELIFEAWAPWLRTLDRLFSVRVSRLPWRWRRRILGLPMDLPRLGRFAIRTLPAWPDRRRIAFSEIPRVISWREAIALAKAFAQQMGWAWVEPARADPRSAARDAPPCWEVYSHASGGLGAMARVAVNARTGAILDHGYIPR